MAAGGIIMFVKSVLLRDVQALRNIKGPISESLRGWNFERSPVRPPLMDVKVSVSAIANSTCPMMRDIYLRHVERKQPGDNSATILGKKVHAIFRTIADDARSIVGSGTAEEVEDLFLTLIARSKEILKDEDIRLRRLYEKLAFRIAYACERFLEEQTAGQTLKDALNAVLPSSFEYRINGGPVGLSEGIHVDAMIWGVPIEIKLGKEKDKHKIALVGYAMAIEASEGYPVDFGILVNVIMNNGNTIRIKDKIVYLDDELRSLFIELRDEALEVIASGTDPGIPEKCDESCYFYEICHGGDVR